MSHFSRPLMIVFLLLFVSACTCYGFSSPAAFLNQYKANEDTVNQSEPIDCSQFAFTTFNHDSTGRVSLVWSSVGTSYRLNVQHDNSQIWWGEFIDGYNTHGFNIQWSNLVGSDQVEIEFIAVGFQGDTCVLRETVSRPAIVVNQIPSMVCVDLRLTSPLGGMANGMQDFYWDALEGAVNYRLTIYDDANSSQSLASVEAGNALNTSLDVNQSTIGGESPLLVELLAFDAAGNVCSQLYDISREAAPPQLVPAVESAPDCVKDPAQAGC